MQPQVPESVIIRAIEPRDAPQIAPLIVQLGYERTVEALADWIESLPDRSSTQAVFVACIAEEVVGWIEVALVDHLQSPRFAQIGGLVVKDGVRSQGIGRRLCQQAEAWAWLHPDSDSLSVDRIRVTSRITRDDAHRFYLRDGYTRIKTSALFEKLRPGSPEEHPVPS